ncbi:MAG: GntR family transcriptional regulator [Propionibacteriaceae bacterium]|nr:GntR family transcriptional regulator [Propionibacteriaceae bacterium]
MRDLEELKLSRRTLKDSAETLIRRALLDGQMKPGEVYSANSLARTLEISNSPVREAMMTLTERGLLELVRNRGFRVVEMTLEDRLEVYELRRLIEVEAVRRVAGLRLSADVAEELRRLASATIDAFGDGGVGSISEYLEADHQFHMYIVDLLGNRRWSEMIERLRDQSRINGFYMHLREAGKVRRTAEEHVALADAIISRDVQRASEVMDHHLQYARLA